MLPYNLQKLYRVLPIKDKLSATILISKYYNSINAIKQTSILAEKLIKNKQILLNQEQLERLSGFPLALKFQ
ncbi:hypothetical protein SS50377_26518 [Spironucleus salmonicida]|uniref:Uncharacterized protein n=1 Tax=Spironucleus salmonicida TaxID=348837 RepID=A0A9P8LQG8_9EUKA|nr:hypothetical protein SS50377_26518 [Spironucleus salmonicida]